MCYLEKLNQNFGETKDDTDDNKTDNKDKEYSEEDEFNPSLAAMEEEIRPKIISTINILVKNYSKLLKYQNEKLNCALNAREFSRSKEMGYKKIKSELINTINK